MVFLSISPKLKIRASLILAFICLQFIVLAQHKRGYLVNAGGDTISITGYLTDNGLIYYKPMGSKKQLYLEAHEVKSVFYDGHLYGFVNNSTRGKGLLIWSEIIAISNKYIFAISKNYSDIYNIYITDKFTGYLVTDYIIADSKTKREGAKQLVLTYFDDCIELKDRIGKNYRFPDGDLLNRGLITCK